MTPVKTITSKSKKFEIYNIILTKYHQYSAGDFTHYALFLPNSKEPDYFEKGVDRNELPD